MDGFCYDAAGNLLFPGSRPQGSNNQNLYDAYGTLLDGNYNQSPRTSYSVDEYERRVAKWQNGAIPRQYLYGADGNLVAEFDGTGNWLQTNVRAGGMFLAELQPSGITYLHTDHLGTIRAESNSAGTRTMTCSNLPFGDSLNCNGNTDPPGYHFTGKDRDSESGNDYFGARYYASSMGRMLSPDPVIATIDRVADPQQWNKYAYARNNPLSITDPTDLDFNLTCSDGKTAICQNGLQGQTTTDANGKSTFTATDVDMNDPSNAGAGSHDQFGNQYTGSFDENSGVSFTDTATGATSSNSRFIDGSDETDVNGSSSGSFSGIQPTFRPYVDLP